MIIVSVDDDEPDPLPSDSISGVAEGDAVCVGSGFVQKQVEVPMCTCLNKLAGQFSCESPGLSDTSLHKQIQ